jgi:CubicO group peptidase (beta-lactamase class C family)
MQSKIRSIKVCAHLSFSMFGCIAMFGGMTSCEMPVEETQLVINLPKAETLPDTALSPAQEAHAQLIREYFAQLHEDKVFNGTVLVGEAGKVIYEDAFGLANRKTKEPLSSDHAFQLASISKPFTAYAALVLKDKGKLNLDDDVTKFIHDFPYEGITIKMLMSHRSGMCNYMYFADEVWPDRYVNPIHNDDVLALLAEYRPMHYYPPNTRYDYSNSGFMVLASIVEKISGKSFEQFMEDEVFGPIGMTNTSVYRKGGPALDMTQVALGYDSRGRESEDTYLNGVVGDKGVYSTVVDMYKFDQAMYEGGPVSAETLAEAFSPMNDVRKNKDNYGLGWRIKTMDVDQRKVIYHTGWWKGFRTYFIRDIELEKTIIVLDNYKKGKFLKVEELINLMHPPVL